MTCTDMVILNLFFFFSFSFVLLFSLKKKEKIISSLSGASGHHGWGDGSAGVDDGQKPGI